VSAAEQFKGAVTSASGPARDGAAVLSAAAQWGRAAKGRGPAEPWRGPLKEWSGELKE
jgi:hypothetical protein